MSSLPEDPVINIQKRWRGYMTRSRRKIYVDDGTSPNIDFGSSAGSIGVHTTPIRGGVPEEAPLDIASPKNIASPKSPASPQGGVLSPKSDALRGQLMRPPRTPPPKMNECVLPTDSVKKEKIPFLKDYDVEIVLDEAVGLPLTTTVTRVQARLCMPTKEDTRDISTFALSDLCSDYVRPKYNFAVRWKGRYLHQTMTIIIRIDTLESPYLEPKTIGFCALRLCVDNLGMQPLSEIISDGRPSCFFNTGEFEIPILYGCFPTDIPFITEAKFQESLPVIPGAFLRLRFSATKNTITASDQSMRGLGSGLSSKAPSAPALRMSSSVLMVDVAPTPKSTKDSLSIYSKTVASILLKNYLMCRARLQPLVLDREVIEAFKKALPIELTARQVALRQISSWVNILFGDNDTPKSTICSKFLLEYNEECGAFASLDMLYNMPDRKRLIPAAENSSSVAAMKNGLSNRWDNKINCFKTVFRYLPGALTSSNNNTSRAHGDVEYKDREVKDTQSQLDALVIDDASMKLSLNSVEQCPAYLDEFSCTAGIKLGPHACLLIVVTAVDILTSKRAPAAPVTRSSFEDTSVSLSMNPQSMLSPSNSKASLFSFDEALMKTERQMRAQRLRGLRGIHVGNNDPKTTWWGIVRLFTKYPSPATDQSSDSHPSSAQREQSEVLTLQGTDIMNCGLSENLDAAALSSLSSLPLFVNYGTHQVPLFQGLPPEEMIVAPDPMAWVVSRLNYQVSRSEDPNNMSPIVKFLASLGGCISPPSSSVANNSEPELLLPNSSSKSTLAESAKLQKMSKKSKKKKKKTEDLILSPGASAFIRMVDPRIKRLAGSSIFIESNREFSAEWLNEIIQINAHYAKDDKGMLSLQLDQNKLKNLKSEFSFQLNKFSHKRSLRMACPETVDPQALVQELNTKFYQSLST